jgi:hypothetical protein
MVMRNTPVPGHFFGILCDMYQTNPVTFLVHVRELHGSPMQARMHMRVRVAIIGDFWAEVLRSYKDSRLDDDGVVTKCLPTAAPQRATERSPLARTPSRVTSVCRRLQSARSSQLSKKEGHVSCILLLLLLSLAWECNCVQFMMPPDSWLTKWRAILFLFRKLSRRFISCCSRANRGSKTNSYPNPTLRRTPLFVVQRLKHHINATRSTGKKT